MLNTFLLNIEKCGGARGVINDVAIWHVGVA
jgi:hypothetical protein